MTMQADLRELEEVTGFGEGALDHAERLLGRLPGGMEGLSEARLALVIASENVRLARMALAREVPRRDLSRSEA